MSDIPYLGESTDAILGEEFLTWLWYQSDTAPGSFVDKNGAPFSVSMEQRIVVQGGEGETRETTSVSGSSYLREARLGLGGGKKVSRALLLLEKEELAWQVSLKADDLSPNSLKTPKIDKQDQDDEPDALLLEKIYLMESCIDLLDALFAQFIKVRLSDMWEKEVNAVQSWIARTE